MPDWLTTTTGQIMVFAVIEAGVLVWLWRSRRRLAFGAAVLVPLLCALIVVLDLWRESPREKVDAALEDVRQAVLAGDAAGVLEHIDPEYEFDGVTHAFLRTWLPTRMADLRITHLRITNRQFTTVTRRRIVVRLEVNASGRVDAGYGFGVRSTWRLTFLPLDDRWTLSAIEPVTLNGRPVRRLIDLP